MGSVCHDDLGICALYDMCNSFGVVVLHRSIVDWRRGGINLPWVDVHYAIYETYLVYWFSRDLCLIGGGVGQSAMMT